MTAALSMFKHRVSIFLYLASQRDNIVLSSQFTVEQMFPINSEPEGGMGY